MAKVIGHYFLYSTADRATEGNLDPVMVKVASEKEANQKAKEIETDRFETWAAYMEVYEDGTVQVSDYPIDEIGKDDGTNGQDRESYSDDQDRESYS